MKKLIPLVALALFGFSSAHADEDAIKQSLNKSMPTLTIESIQPAEISGLYEVKVGGNIFYVSEDGKYLVQGHIVDITNRTDLTEQKLAGSRLQALEKIGENNMIIFKPKIGKYTVTVFTDIDCGYCRKLHSEIDQYHAQGIAIRYLFFPRAGKGSESYNKAVAVWCAKDRHAALTAAKRDQKIEMKTCDNPIDQHMKLGEAFEMKGTPMIITEKGNVYPGYLPAKQLLEVLESESKSK